MEFECLMETDASRLFTIFTMTFIVVGFFWFLGWRIRCLHKWLYGKSNRYRKMYQACAKIKTILIIGLIIIIIGLACVILWHYVNGAIYIWKCLSA